MLSKLKDLYNLKPAGQWIYSGVLFFASGFRQRDKACFPWQWPCGPSLFAGPLRRKAPAHIWRRPHTSAVAFSNNDLEAPSARTAAVCAAARCARMEVATVQEASPQSCRSLFGGLSQVPGALDKWFAREVLDAGRCAQQAYAVRT